MTSDVTMKPLLAVAIKEALRLAIDDSQMDGDMYLRDIDLDALAINLCLRLLGTGGWMVRGAYAGNASPQQILHACIDRPGRENIAPIIEALGLKEDPLALRVIGEAEA